MANSVDLDEVAHDEPPHQGLHCLQIHLDDLFYVDMYNVAGLLYVIVIPWFVRLYEEIIISLTGGKPWYHGITILYHPHQCRSRAV